MSVLGIVPVKVNSSRVPFKNIRKLNEKPLFLYSLDALIKSEVADVIIVCSENLLIESILNLQKYFSLNPNLIFQQRPQYLSEDPCQIADVCLWVIDQMQTKYDDLVMIQPSNPLVTSEDIISAYELYQKNGRVFQVRSMNKIKKNVWRRSFDDRFLYFLKNKFYDYFIGNGSIVIESIERFIEEKDLVCDCLPYIMPKERSIDIDDEIDFKLAKILIEERKG